MTTIHKFRWYYSLKISKHSSKQISSKNHSLWWNSEIRIMKIIMHAEKKYIIVNIVMFSKWYLQAVSSDRISASSRRPNSSRKAPRCTTVGVSKRSVPLTSTCVKTSKVSDVAFGVQTEFLNTPISLKTSMVPTAAEGLQLKAPKISPISPKISHHRFYFNYV